MYHILIIGAGSIGISLGASLRSQGMNITFLAREKNKNSHRNKRHKKNRFIRRDLYCSRRSHCRLIPCRT